MDFQHIHLFFKDVHTATERFEKIIELGRLLPDFPDQAKSEANRVTGCQSQLFLLAELSEDKIVFRAWSDALISAGLAALLIKAYEGCTPLEFLRVQPLFLKELGILDSLSPSRSNGVGSLFSKMRQEALKLLSSQIN